MVKTSIHNNIEPSWLPQTAEILYSKGFVVWEFWNTFSTEKSETIYKYINKKKEIKDEINSPMTLITSNFLFLLFLELKNCVIEKTKVK